MPGEIAPEGSLRAAINLGNPVLAQRHTDGRLAGVTVALARALAAQLGVPVALHAFPTAADALAALAGGACDIGFLARDPQRAEQLAYTAPYVVIEGTCLVRAASPIRDIAAIDAPGLRIAAGRDSAYDLHLTRSLRHAALHRADGNEATIALFDAGLDLLAGVRQPLEALAAARGDLRVLPGGFMRIEQAMAVPRARLAALPAIEAFLAAMKASGAVRFGLDASGQADAAVA